MRIAALIFFFIGSVLAVFGAEGGRVREAVARIKNSDVDFQGEYPGVVEHISFSVFGYAGSKDGRVVVHHVVAEANAL